MKNLAKWNIGLAGVLCAIFGGQDCLGHIGQTEAQVAVEYGTQPLKHGTLLGHPCAYYALAETIITVVFVGGKSACEMVFPDGEHTGFTDEDCVGTLKDFTGATDAEKDQRQPENATRWRSKTGAVVLRSETASKRQILTVMSGAFERQNYSRAPAGSAEAQDAREVAALEKTAAAQRLADEFKYYHDHAASGEPLIQFYLAEYYLQGKGCERDTNQARIWFQKAADQGNEKAKLALQDLDGTRSGVAAPANASATPGTKAVGETNASPAQPVVEPRKSPADVATFKFHLARAQAGNQGSQLRVGQLYLEGKGCDRNTNQAKIWFQKAADQGDADAKAALDDLK